MSDLAVLNDLLGPLPPRTGLAYCLAAEAEADPNIGPLFRSLTSNRVPVSKFPTDLVVLWIYTGLVHISLRPVGRRDLLCLYMVPSSLGSACLAQIRHNLIETPDPSQTQFPGLSLAQARRASQGQHPANNSQIQALVRCGNCIHIDGHTCKLAIQKRNATNGLRLSFPTTHPNWDGCASYRSKHGTSSQNPEPQSR